MVRALLKNNVSGDNPTEEDIKKAIRQVSQLLPLDETEMDYIERSLQSSFKVRMDLGKGVYNQATYHPWIARRKATIDPYYWNRYEKYLQLDQGWEEEIVKKLGQVSDEILDLCGNPEEKGRWKRKGLILGDIQSGKTSNYLALCNKAADAGYKIIILLTGTIESLRKQTQGRVDAGFVGVNSRNVLQKNPEKKFIGVGSIDSNRTAMPFTNILSDFNSDKLQALNFTVRGMNEPIIFVLKKNKSALENLATWLSTRNTTSIGEKIDLPLLLIDDEADNASVNTNKPDKNPTTINNAIVEILKLFERSSYVAVTATPFANIFIDPDLDKGEDEFNLFPCDFIYALSAPTNYIGADRIFPENSEFNNSLEVIDDVTINVENGEYVFRSKNKSAHVVPYLPKSLKNAIKYFLLVNVAMDLRGNTKNHRSMLINVSQFVNVQNQVFDMVTDYLKQYQLKIHSYANLDLEKVNECKEIVSLMRLWRESGFVEKTNCSEIEMLKYLNKAVAPIQTALVNQKTKQKGVERLDYEPYDEQGLRVIAVGGNSLSRGLTLEGLCVSYFDRNSQMYDTLMQMGRWFGYRKGYDDLFKIWMEPTAMGWYQYISDATNELKDEIDEMRRVGLTPKEFGLKVQQNMVSLFVTARSKMRATTTVEQWVSLDSEVVETPRLIANSERCLKNNLNITNDLIKKINNGNSLVDPKYNFEKNRLVFTKVDKRLISDYVKSFVAHPRHIPFSSKDLSSFIKESDDFPTWTVAIIGGSGEELESKYFADCLLHKGLHYSSRIIERDDNCLLIYGQRARVGVPGATRYGLTKEQIDKVKKDFESKKENKGKMTVPDKPYLKMDRDPVLLIYLIKIDTEIKENRKHNSDKASIDFVGDFPVVGIGLGFPGNSKDCSSKSTKVKYVLNRVSEHGIFDFEAGDEDED